MIFKFSKKTVEQIPQQAGVYIFYNENKQVVYIGKALNLKKRLSSYLTIKSSQGIFLPEKVEFFEYIISQNEKDAFLTERDLIRSKKPKYNIKLKDDKSYLYLRIKTDTKFPFIDLKRTKENPKDIYFGPFVPTSYAYKLLRLIEKAFKIRTCRGKLKKRKRPCLNYFIEHCSAPCVNYINEKDYNNRVKDAINFLKTEDTDYIDKLKTKMKKSADKLDFEKSAEIRDTIFALESIKRSTYRRYYFKNDIDAWSIKKSNNSYLFFMVRVQINGEIGDKKEFFYKNIKISEYDFFYSFFTEFYSQYSPPKKIIIPYPLESDLRKSLSKFLSSFYEKKTKIYKGKSNKFNDLIKNVNENAEIKLKEYLRNNSLKQIKKIASLTKIPERIEGVDISHFAGKNIVGSKVSFFRGEPEKNLYRRYFIKKSDLPDDVKNIYKIIKRRFSGTDKNIIPDLLLIDGGKQQLNSAKKAIETIGLEIKIISISKGKQDKLHFLDNTVYFDDESPGFNLLKKVRDEAHRFAIKYQRRKRSFK